ncbi:MAG: LysR family transcriptional regulator [Synergistaceae bacterium]|nr:LysR family transcriptional regulator [Synergistaceae bacterium]
MYNPRLDTFLQVAESGSFNKTAEQIHITATAVIKQINLLEAELGVKLFARTHRGVRLTEAGQSLYKDSKYIINYCRDSVERAKNAMMKAQSIIRIGTSPMTPPQFLVDLWPKIHEKAPEFRFQLVPFENTPENAREILGNLGQNIDVVAGIFDDVMLDVRRCAALEILREPICVAVSIHNPIAAKERLELTDLHGQRLLLMHRGWSGYVDDLRDDLWQHHPQIEIVDFDFYNVEIFNRCENSNDLLMAVGKWDRVHPLLKIIPVKWSYTIPFGFLHAPSPSDTVQKFLETVQAVMQD